MVTMSSPRENQEWYYVVDGTQQGPVDASDIEGMLALGSLSPQTLVWTDGMQDWMPVRDIPEFKILSVSSNENDRPTTARRSGNSRRKPSQKAHNKAADGKPATSRRHSKPTPASKRHGTARRPTRKRHSVSKADTPAVPHEAKQTDRMFLVIAYGLPALVLLIFAAYLLSPSADSTDSFIESFARFVESLGAYLRKKLAPVIQVAEGIFLVAITQLILWSPFLTFVMADINRRKENGKWFAAIFVCPPVIYPFYYSRRRLLRTEIREGGRVWNWIRGFVITWTYLHSLEFLGAYFFEITLLPVFFDGLRALTDFITAVLPATHSVGKRSVLHWLVALRWFAPIAPLMVIGHFFRERSVIERGEGWQQIGDSEVKKQADSES